MAFSLAVRPARLLPRLARRAAHSTAFPSGLASVDQSDVAHFASILPANAVISTLTSPAAAPDDLQPYNNDWMGKYTGKSTTVLRPRTTQQVSDIMKHCYQRRIPVVPQGGNTGLVGGSVPLRDELVISLGSMNNVRSFDPVTGLSPPAPSAIAVLTWRIRHPGRRRRMHSPGPPGIRRTP